MTKTSAQSEDVEAFRVRARAWLAENMPEAGDPDFGMDMERWQRERELQRKLFEGGFAGLCFPTEYGGQGLPYSYQRSFDVEAGAYDLPFYIDIPTFGIIGATILDFTTTVADRGMGSKLAIVPTPKNASQRVHAAMWDPTPFVEKK